MKIFLKILIISTIALLTGCGLGTAEDNRKSKLMSGSVDQVIARSGTTFRSNDRAMKDAYNRLNTGGGLFGKKGISVDKMMGQTGNSSSASIGLPINAILWKSSLEVINFMPLSSADPFAGVIISDWYTPINNSKERCKVNIFIKGKEFKSNNLNVNTFCQKFTEGQWIDVLVNQENDIKLENAILNKAKKIKLSIN